MSSGHDHWNEHARRWSHVGPPLRPCQADIALVESCLREHLAKRDGDVEALLLGVTPELALMSWPDRSRLLAVDRNLAMLGGVWPQARLRLPALAVCADWLALPCADGSRNVVLGDGCLTLLPSATHYARFFAEMRRVLTGDGCFIIRHFTRPDDPEQVDAVFAALLGGRIGNFHVFKWRLAMALHGSLAEGVNVGTIWEEWNRRNISALELSRRLGWPVAAINTIDSYRGSDMRYTFPTLAELSRIAGHYFDEQSHYFMTYELGERCPTFCLVPKGSR